jgi:hypothetical protein
MLELEHNAGEIKEKLLRMEEDMEEEKYGKVRALLLMAKEELNNPAYVPDKYEQVTRVMVDGYDSSDI